MKQTFLTLVAVGALTLVGCNKNDSLQTPYVSATSEEVNISLLTQAPTKATEAGSAEESKVTSLEFYVFDSAGALDTEVGRVDATTPGNGYLKITATNSFNHKLRVSSGTDKLFLVVANADLGAPASTDTYAIIKAKLASAAFTATAGSTDHNSRTVPTSGFVISGTAKASVVAGKGDNKVYITIARLVSKINTPTIADDVAVSLTQEQINEVWGAGTTVDPATVKSFAFKGYAVINGVDKSNISFVGNASGVYSAPSTTIWDLWSNTGKAHLNSAFDASGDYTNNYSGKTGSVWFLDGTTGNNADRVFVYENKPSDITVNSVVGYDPTTVYAYIIEGELTANSVTEKRYWRVDLIKDDIYHIVRNSVYKVSISKISTPGYKTPEDAEKLPGIVPGVDQTAADFVISVANWDIKTYETEM